MKKEYTTTTFRLSDEDEKLIEKIMLEKSFKTKNKTVKFCLAFYNEQYPALVEMNDELESKLSDLNQRYINLINSFKKIENAKEVIKEEEKFIVSQIKNLIYDN